MSLSNNPPSTSSTSRAMKRLVFFLMNEDDFEFEPVELEQVGKCNQFGVQVGEFSSLGGKAASCGSV